MRTKYIGPYVSASFNIDKEEANPPAVKMPCVALSSKSAGSEVKETDIYLNASVAHMLNYLYNLSMTNTDLRSSFVIGMICHEAVSLMCFQSKKNYKESAVTREESITLLDSIYEAVNNDKINKAKENNASNKT